MSFQKNVAVSALVVLSICLIIVGIILLRMRKNVKFPANIGQCPDYFDVVKDGDSIKCEFKHQNNDVSRFYENKGVGQKRNVDGIPCSEIAPYDSKYVGIKGNEAKCRWAKQCDVTWDGITNRGIC
jgi:hypothetical protein